MRGTNEASVRVVGAERACVDSLALRHSNEKSPVGGGSRSAIAPPTPPTTPPTIAPVWLDECELLPVASEPTVGVTMTVVANVEVTVEPAASVVLVEGKRACTRGPQEDLRI